MSEPKKLPEIPGDLLYSRSHEWARQDKDDVLVGITAHAVEEMGHDIVHVDLPQVGQRVAAHESFGVIDSVKAAFDLFSPISGEVNAINSEVLKDPSVVARAPYKEGWMIRLRPDNLAQLDDLLGPGAYKDHCLSEEKHS